MQKIEISDPSELDAAAKEILNAATPNKFFILKGAMGAGKTTLIKALCNQLGSKDLVSSPTFSIVNEYLSPYGKLYHFDFYRLKSIQEAYDIGYEEYFFSGDFCFVEWPEKIEELIPDQYFEINILTQGETQRCFEFQEVRL